jgi:hypothetical protein
MRFPLSGAKKGRRSSKPYPLPTLSNTRTHLYQNAPTVRRNIKQNATMAYKRAPPPTSMGGCGGAPPGPPPLPRWRSSPDSARARRRRPPPWPAGDLRAGSCRGVENWWRTGPAADEHGWRWRSTRAVSMAAVEELGGRPTGAEAASMGGRAGGGRG